MRPAPEGMEAGAMNPHALCFPAILAGVLAVTFLWLIAIDVSRLADAIERLARKDGER